MDFLSIKNIFLKKYLIFIIIIILYYKNDIHNILQKFYIYPIILFLIIYKNHENIIDLIILSTSFFIADFRG